MIGKSALTLGALWLCAGALAGCADTLRPATTATSSTSSASNTGSSTGSSTTSAGTDTTSTHGASTSTGTSTGAGTHTGTTSTGGAGTSSSSSGGPTPDIIGFYSYSYQDLLLLSANSATATVSETQIDQPATALTVHYPIAGDFFGTGVSTVGFYDLTRGIFYLNRSNHGGPTDESITFGDIGALPIAGDFSGTGTVGIGTYNPTTGAVVLRYEASAGTADVDFTLPTGGLPITGHFSGPGPDTVGLYSTTSGQFQLFAFNATGTPSVTFALSPTGLPVAGDFDGDGTSTVGVLDSTGVLHLRNSNSAGPDDLSWAAPMRAFALIPLAANWGPVTPETTVGYAWPTATPTAESVSASDLSSADSQLAASAGALSFLVARHGQLIHETYFNGGRQTFAFNVKSVSKSILSALTGIAANQGLLSITDPVANYLPTYLAILDAAHQQIEIQNLMQMMSGLTWNEDDQTFFESILAQNDWVAATLDEPMAATPGTTFDYSTGNTMVMSALLTNVTGMSTSAFAQTELFSPIGVQVARWDTELPNFDIGGADVYLVARDMLRFGQLYLDNGLVNGTQVVPSAWVTSSTATVVPAADTGENTGYADWWWTIAFGSHASYYASGYGAQAIYVLPDLDAVVVFTLTDEDSETAQTAAQQFVYNLMLNTVVPAFN